MNRTNGLFSGRVDDGDSVLLDWFSPFTIDIELTRRDRDRHDYDC